MQYAGISQKGKPIERELLNIFIYLGAEIIELVQARLLFLLHDHVHVRLVGIGIEQQDGHQQADQQNDRFCKYCEFHRFTLSRDIIERIRSPILY
ncbi:hypothetical protein D3C76_1397060 [compost metagenome]